MNHSSDAIDAMFGAALIDLRHTILECMNLSREAREAMTTSTWMGQHQFHGVDIADEIDDKMRPMALCLEHLEEASRYLEMTAYTMRRTI